MDIKEKELLSKLYAGTLLDKDIQDILYHGSRELKRALESHADNLRKKKQHYAIMNNIHPRSFDGISKSGEPFKELAPNHDFNGTE